MRIKNPTRFEVDGLKGTCAHLNCSMSELIDAIMSYCIRDYIGEQIEFNREKANYIREMNNNT